MNVYSRLGSKIINNYLRCLEKIGGSLPNNSTCNKTYENKKRRKGPRGKTCGESCPDARLDSNTKSIVNG